MPREHVIDPTRIHHTWDASLEPTLRIQFGDIVRYVIRKAGRGQVENGMPYEQATFDFDTL